MLAMSIYINRRAVEGSARTYPSTPRSDVILSTFTFHSITNKASFCYRRQAKYGHCNENHGIRVPSPEQYLTPLQQKEVCIRHLRARLRENTERLQHRDFEIDDLRTQLYRMQEEWIEGECHRVEAQLALKEARREIQHLQEVVETVRSNLGVRTVDPQDNKPYAGLQAARGGRSRSCGCSPASTLSRSASHKRMSTETLHPDPSGASKPPGQTHLLLEASLLSEQLPPQGGLLQTSQNVPHSSSFDRLYCGGTLLPLSHSCHSLGATCRCSGHSYPPHHHLFLHLPQEEPPPTVTTTTSDPIPTPTAPTIPTPRTTQPHATAEPPDKHGSAEPAETEEQPEEPLQDGTERVPPQRYHWSRYFLVDLLALAMPVVPTMAWLCRGAPRDDMPVYHIGSLLRGCCAVALHSLRRLDTPSQSFI
uniref:Uncharacterized protein n=1 Tax=Periophthalmus magnuspinnatus TaxID=409849 RepID=A0A3B3ZIW6_9GOBI